VEILLALFVLLIGFALYGLKVLWEKIVEWLKGKFPSDEG